MSLTKSNIVYPAIYYRIPVFLFAAHYLVAYGEPEGFFTLLQLPYYYFAVLGSFIIALAVGESVLAITRYLDQKRPWRTDFNRRLILQLSLGLLPPLILAILLASAYFYIRGKHIVTSGYFRFDFTLVVGFVVILNLVYLAVAQLQGFRQPAKMHLSSKRKPSGISEENDEVVAIYTVGQGYMAVLKNGESMIWSKTLEQSLTELPEKTYFLINRSDIVSRYLIEGYELGDSRRLKLILKWPLPDNRNLMVSQRRVVMFKRWYKDIEN